jgi:hypothetical protein
MGLNNDNWFKVHRELFEKPIFLNSSPEHFKVLMVILKMANFAEKEWEWGGKSFKAAPGQFVTSLESIRQNCGKGVTIQNIRSAITRFEKLGFLTNEATKTGRLITIVNWAAYQATKDNGNKGANKEVTKSQQRGNKEVTKRLTPKEECYKEGREGKNGRMGENRQTPSARNAARDSGPPPADTVLSIPLARKNGDGNPELFHVTKDMVEDWQSDFPGVDVIQELHKANAWNKANPTKRKTRSGIRRHLAGWLGKAQDKGNGANAKKSPYSTEVCL